MEKKKRGKAKVSFRAAINEKCRSCIYDELSKGTWRKQVEGCLSEKTCPLWPVRPVPTKKDEPNAQLQ